MTRRLRFVLFFLALLGGYFALLSTIPFASEARASQRPSPSNQRFAVKLRPSSTPSPPPVASSQPLRRLPAAQLTKRRTFGVIAGQPVGVIWFVWFVALAILAIVWPRLPEALHQSLPVHLYLFGTVLLAASLYFGYGMFTQRVLCIPCLGNVVMTLLVFVVLTRVPSSSVTAGLRSVPKDLIAFARRPILFALIVVVPIAAGAWALSSAHRTTASTSMQWSSRAAFLDWYGKQPRVSVPGLRTKPVVLVEFQDYQCPPCRKMYFEHAALREKYAHTARGLEIVSKDFPLDSECNAFVKAPMHPLACRAAAAVRLARRNGKGPALEHWLFANQDQITRESLDGAAREIGGVADVEASYRSEFANLAEDIKFGRALSVQGTPTFFLNGVRLPPLPADLLDAAIEMEMRRAQ